LHFAKNLGNPHRGGAPRRTGRGAATMVRLETPHFFQSTQSQQGRLGVTCKNKMILKAEFMDQNIFVKNLK